MVATALPVRLSNLSCFSPPPAYEKKPYPGNEIQYDKGRGLPEAGDLRSTSTEWTITE
jgi:hypothetical protein